MLILSASKIKNNNSQVRLQNLQEFIKIKFTEPQNGYGWKRPLEITWSNPSAQAGAPRAGCPGPRPGGF